MDPRFDLPIFTRAETSTHLDLPPSTLGYWLRTGALDAMEARPGEASMTFASESGSRTSSTWPGQASRTH